MSLVSKYILGRALLCAALVTGSSYANSTEQATSNSGPEGGPGKLSLIAGNIDGLGFSDGVGKMAHFGTYYGNGKGIAIDNSGNLYIADVGNRVIRRVTPDGAVTTFAGKPGSSGSEDGVGSEARFSSPAGIAIDTQGNLYVTDSGNHTIRKITPSAVVTTLAGSPDQQGTNNGFRASARFMEPRGITVNGEGVIYVADNVDVTIRRISREGMVTTLAGASQKTGFNDGKGTSALFSTPMDIAVDRLGVVYVADEGNNAIRQITPDGAVSTLLGATVRRGNADGPLAIARIVLPKGIGIDGDGSIYVSQGFVIRKIGTDGIVSTVAGHVDPDGKIRSVDGIGRSAEFYNSGNVTTDKAGNLYVADALQIRKISPQGVVTTLAGSTNVVGYKDGAGPAALFNELHGIAADERGNLYVNDSYNALLRKIDATGKVTTFAGTGMLGVKDGVGTTAQLPLFAQLIADAKGNLFFADEGASVIRKIDTASGSVTTIAGTAGIAGEADGRGGSARFNQPSGMASDSSGNLYVYDKGSDTIRKISPTYVVTTVHGISLKAEDEETTWANAYKRIVIDPKGNFYYTTGTTIRKVSPDGKKTIIAGQPGQIGDTDGAGNNARFYYPECLKSDLTGNIYVCDGAAAIRRIAPDGMVTTLEGPGHMVEMPSGALGYLGNVYDLTVIDPKTLMVTTGSAVLKLTLP